MHKDDFRNIAFSPESLWPVQTISDSFLSWVILSVWPCFVFFFHLIPFSGLILWVIVWASPPLVCVPCVFSTVYSMSSLLKHQAGCINTPWQCRLASIDVCLAWHFPSVPEQAHQCLPTGLLDPRGCGIVCCHVGRVCLLMCMLSGLCSHLSISGHVQILAAHQMYPSLSNIYLLQVTIAPPPGTCWNESRTGCATLNGGKDKKKFGDISLSLLVLGERRGSPVLKHAKKGMVDYFQSSFWSTHKKQKGHWHSIYNICWSSYTGSNI